MPPRPIIIYERLGHWARQLRPRFRGWSIRWSEARSAEEVARAASRSTWPILVIDLGDNPVRGLEALDAGLVAAPSALGLVLDPHDHQGLATTARELGATLVLSGVIVPPRVVGLLQRWLPLAQRRSEAESESDLWSVFDPFSPHPAPNPGPGSIREASPSGLATDFDR